MNASPEYYEKGIFCCCCACIVQPELVTGSDVYPHRDDLGHKKFWRCLGCANYVGCHPGGKRPLGNIPTPELRKARQHIHAILDPLWKSGRIGRGAVYARISERIGQEYHTGEIKSVEDARNIYRIVKEIAAEESARLNQTSKNRGRP